MAQSSLYYMYLRSNLNTLQFHFELRHIQIGDPLSVRSGMVRAQMR
jgi:hypothetical protein